MQFCLSFGYYFILISLLVIHQENLSALSVQPKPVPQSLMEKNPCTEWSESDLSRYSTYVSPEQFDILIEKFYPNNQPLHPVVSIHGKKNFLNNLEVFLAESPFWNLFISKKEITPSCMNRLPFETVGNIKDWDKILGPGSAVFGIRIKQKFAVLPTLATFMHGIKTVNETIEKPSNKIIVGFYDPLNYQLPEEIKKLYPRELLDLENFVYLVLFHHYGLLPFSQIGALYYHDLTLHLNAIFFPVGLLKTAQAFCGFLVQAFVEIFHRNGNIVDDYLTEIIDSTARETDIGTGGLKPTVIDDVKLDYVEQIYNLFTIARWVSTSPTACGFLRSRLLGKGVSEVKISDPPPYVEDVIEHVRNLNQSNQYWNRLNLWGVPVVSALTVAPWFRYKARIDYLKLKVWKVQEVYVAAADKILAAM